MDALYSSHGKPLDRWLDVRWDPPALMQLVVGVTPTGNPERVALETPGVHLMAPETDSSTHYFWSLKPVVLECDKGAIRARLILKKIIAEEESSKAHNNAP